MTRENYDPVVDYKSQNLSFLVFLTNCAISCLVIFILIFLFVYSLLFISLLLPNHVTARRRRCSQARRAAMLMCRLHCLADESEREPL